MFNAAEFQIEQNPNNADEWCFLGQVHLSNGAYSQAYTSLKKSIELDPDNAKSYYYLELYYRVKKDLPRAEYNFIKTIKINSNNAKAHGNLGLVYFEKKGTINQNYTFSVLWKSTRKMKSQEKKFKLWREMDFRQGSGWAWPRSRTPIESVFNRGLCQLMGPRSALPMGVLCWPWLQFGA